MRNELFDDESLEVLLNPASWRIISALFDEDVPSIHRQSHLAWMRSHVDSHPAREVLVALKGEGVYGYNGKVYPCAPGTVFLFDAYEAHDNFYAPDSARMTHLWFCIFEDDLLGRILRIDAGRLTPSTKSSLILSGTAAARHFASAWHELTESRELPPAFKRAKLVGALSALLLQLVEKGYGAAPPPLSRDLHATVIGTIQRHIATTAGRDIPLAEAARLAGYSKFHFLRLFKQETGQTFHGYVNACRLRKAQAMLAERRTKTEISETLGFSHPSAFLRWFRSLESR